MLPKLFKSLSIGWKIRKLIQQLNKVKISKKLSGASNLCCHLLSTFEKKKYSVFIGIYLFIFYFVFGQEKTFVEFLLSTNSISMHVSSSRIIRNKEKEKNLHKTHADAQGLGCYFYVLHLCYLGWHFLLFFDFSQIFSFWFCCFLLQSTTNRLFLFFFILLFKT